MSEGMEGGPTPAEQAVKPQPPTKTGGERRGAIIRVVKGLAAGATIGASFLGLRKELGVVENGIDTKWGLFYPLYERHDRGIKVLIYPKI